MDESRLGRDEQRRQPVRRDRRRGPSTWPTMPTSSGRSPPRGAPSTRPIGRGRRSATGSHSSTGSPTCSSGTGTRSPGLRRSTPARPCARAATTSTTSSRSSATTRASPTRRPVASLRRLARRHQPDRLRADRGMRAHRPVELPAPPDQLEGGAGARRRRHDGPQAGVAHAADDDHPRPELIEEAGVPAGVVNLVLGPGGRVGEALAASPDVDLGQPDGRPRGRPADPPGRRRQRQARRARARWQEPEHRLRRRRLRDRRRQRPDRGVRPQRPGLLGRLPADRRGLDPRPVRRRAGPTRRRDPPGLGP